MSILTRHNAAIKPLSPDLCREVKVSWIRAFHNRKGLVCVFNPYDILRNNPPPYMIDPSGYGAGFCELGKKEI